MGKLQQFYNDKVKRRSLMIYILACMTFVIMIFCKKNYHVDETTTFGLSNHHSIDNSINISVEDGKKYMLSDTAYLEYMTVQPEGRFDYYNVWVNQEHDVLPPLYYILIHTICSFFPGKVSMWFPGIVNIVFMLATLYMFRKLLQYLCNDDMIVLYASLFFIFSAGMLSIVTFMRMYVMTMFFATWITYLLLQGAEEGITSRQKYIGIFSVTVMGTLTHYYFIIYVVFLCVSIGIYVLLQKRWKDILQLLAVMITSAGASIIIFPSMFNHIFVGYRGKESFQNYKETTSLEYWNSIKKFYTYLNDQLMGGLLGYILLASIILFFIGWLQKESKDYNSTKEICYLRRCAIIGVSSAAYFFMITKIAIYQTDRFISPVYAVVIAVIMALLAMIIKRYHTARRNKQVLLSIVLAMALVTSWKSCDWAYLYTDSIDLLDKLDSYQDKDCIYIYNEVYRVQPSYLEIKKFNSVTFYKEDHYDDMFNSDILNQRELVLYIVNSCNVDSILKNVVARSPYINKYQQLGSFGYANSYRLYSENVEIQDKNLYSYDEEQTLVVTRETNNAELGQIKEENAVRIVKKPGNDFVTIYKGKMALDIVDEAYRVGNNVRFYRSNNSDAQHWRVVQNEDGTIFIITMNNKYALTRTIDGNVVLDNYNQDNENQKWWLK